MSNKTALIRVPKEVYVQIDSIAREFKCSRAVAFNIWKKKNVDVKWKNM